MIVHSEGIFYHVIKTPLSDSLTPLLLGGNSLNNLIELKTININPTDTTVPLLNDCTEVSRSECIPFWWFADDGDVTFLTISVLIFNPFPLLINDVYFKIWHVHNLNLLLIRSAWKGNSSHSHLGQKHGKCPCQRSLPGTSGRSLHLAQQFSLSVCQCSTVFLTTHVPLKLHFVCTFGMRCWPCREVLSIDLFRLVRR